MRALHILAVMALVWAGCGPANDPMKVTINIRGTLPDPQMDAAIAQARASITNFIALLQSPQTNLTLFAISARFVSHEKRIEENIWITDLRYRGSFFEGAVETARSEMGFALGEPVKIALSNVVDWMYVQNGRAIGCFTGRVMRSRMSEQERQRADAQISYKFE